MSLSSIYRPKRPPFAGSSPRHLLSAHATGMTVPPDTAIAPVTMFLLQKVPVGWGRLTGRCRAVGQHGEAADDQPAAMTPSRSLGSFVDATA